MIFIKQLKKHPTLYQIHLWILKVEEEGWGEVEFVVKCHDYKAKTIDMKAIKPKNKNVKSFTKRIRVDNRKEKG